MRRRLRLGCLAGLILIALPIVLIIWPLGKPFTVSPQTTYVTGPIDEEGYVDYVTALNERLGKGITPETNANVLICRALGPLPEKGSLPDEYFHWLGIDPPPENGDVLVRWEDYCEKHAKNGDGKKNAAQDDLVYESTSKVWTSKDHPDLADWLLQNDKPLVLVVEATRRPAYYNPLVPNKTTGETPCLLDALLPTVQRCRGLGVALLCRAMLRTGQGKVDEAWQDLLACHRLARLVSRGGTLIEFLVGVAIESIAEKADLVFLENASLTSRQVLACWEDLERLPPMATVAEKIDVPERLVVLDTILQIARFGPMNIEQKAAGGTAKPSETSQSLGRLLTRGTNWDPALMAVNEWYDRLAACLRISDRNAREQELKVIDQELRALKNGVVSLGSIMKVLGPRGRGEVIGNIMLSLLMPAVQKVQGAADRCEQQQRNLHLAFALAAYRRDQGHYPAKLDDLRPKYIKEIPGDLFSGKPLVYRLVDKGYLLYSVGPNGMDDGGRGNDDTPRGDDLSIRMPVPPPPSKK